MSKCMSFVRVTKALSLIKSKQSSGLLFKDIAEQCKMSAVQLNRLRLQAARCI
jgi:hypothetical protein